MRKKNFQVTTYQGVWFYEDDTPVLFENWDGKKTIGNMSSLMYKKDAIKLLDTIMEKFPKISEAIILDHSKKDSIREITYVRTI